MFFVAVWAQGKIDVSAEIWTEDKSYLQPLKLLVILWMDFMSERSVQPAKLRL